PPVEGGNPPPTEGGGSNPPSSGGGTNQGSAAIVEAEAEAGAGAGIGSPLLSGPALAFTGDHLRFLMLLGALMLLVGALFWLRGAEGTRDGPIERKGMM